MKLNFTGKTDEVFRGIEILSKRLDFEISDRGFEVRTQKIEKGLSVDIKEDSAVIGYEKKHHFFRALGIMMEHFGEECSIFEIPKIKSNGLMVDMSRGAVMTVEALRDFTEIMALMGYNVLMLYTEDTYEVEGYPYFGYMRGRYSYDELKACDDYADIFGIELVPCIQVLGHLSKTLRWNHGKDIRDTAGVLLVGSEDTKEFVKTLIIEGSKPFRSRRIHLGMDEAWDLGLGKYLRRNGYKPSNQLIREHCKVVEEIVDELGLKGMIWADMYFRAKSSTGDYYDNLTGEFTEEDISCVSKNLTLVYWDYYKESKEEYNKLIKMHKQLSDDVIFAGGIWSWSRMTACWRKTLAVAKPAITACIENGIEESITTIWGDDGNEANILGCLYGMQLYAELSYGHGDELDFLDSRFKACTGENGTDFRNLDLLDDFGQGEKAANGSKSMFWQDPLIGLFDKNIDIENISQLYGQRKQVLKAAAEESKNAYDLFMHAYHVANVLELKADLGIVIKKYYDEKNKSQLLNIASVIIPEVIKRVNELKNVHRRLWLSQYKVFGFEELDRRYGAVLARLENAQFRLTQYINGEVESLPELDAERLLFNPNVKGLNYSELSYGALKISDGE